MKVISSLCMPFFVAHICHCQDLTLAVADSWGWQVCSPVSQGVPEELPSWKRTSQGIMAPACVMCLIEVARVPDESFIFLCMGHMI